MSALGEADPALLALAPLCVLASYTLMAVTVRHTGGRQPIPAWLSFRAALIAFGLGNLLPGAPAPGATLAVMDLRRHGIQTRRAGLALTWSAWCLIRAFLGLAATAAIIGVAEHHVPAEHEALTLGLASFVLALVLASVLFVLHPRPVEWAALALARLRWRGIDTSDARATGALWHARAMEAMGSGFNRELVALVAATAWLCDVLCLNVALQAVGVEVSFDVLLLGYVFAILAASIPFLPGGAGAVEAVLPAILHHFGAPLEQAIAGTLAWRALSLLFPAAVGALLLVGPRLLAVRRVAPLRGRAAARVSAD
jgi:uncharacterized protein (TIRG00374 family)